MEETFISVGSSIGLELIVCMYCCFKHGRKGAREFFKLHRKLQIAKGRNVIVGHCLYSLSESKGQAFLNIRYPGPTVDPSLCQYSHQADSIKVFCNIRNGSNRNPDLCLRQDKITEQLEKGYSDTPFPETLEIAGGGGNAFRKSNEIK